MSLSSKEVVLVPSCSSFVGLVMCLASLGLGADTSSAVLPCRGRLLSVNVLPYVCCAMCCVCWLSHSDACHWLKCLETVAVSGRTWFQPCCLATISCLRCSRVHVINLLPLLPPLPTPPPLPSPLFGLYLTVVQQCLITVHHIAPLCLAS